METDLRRIATDIFTTALKIWPEQDGGEGVKFAVERAKEIVEQCGGETLMTKYHNLEQDHIALLARYRDARILLAESQIETGEEEHGK